MIIQLIYPYFCYQHFNIPSVTYCKFSIFPVFIMKKCICFILLICSCTCCTSTNNLRSVKIQATNVPLYDSLPHNIEGAYLHLPNNRFDFGKINRKKIPNIPMRSSSPISGQSLWWSSKRMYPADVYRSNTLKHRYCRIKQANWSLRRIYAHNMEHSIKQSSSRPMPKMMS